MAILNVTPDSFADGGAYATPEAAAAAAAWFVGEGADVIDVGGESTRPGAARVGADEQLRRVLPVIRAIRAGGVTRGVPVTIDTTLARVARAAFEAGADAINDVSGGTEDPGMLPLAAERGAGVVLMHRLAPPTADSYSDRYASPPEYSSAGVVEDVAAYLRERALAALRAGVARDAIVLDPGLGFGKTVEQNVALIDGTRRLLELGYPILSALSRKSFVGRLSLGRESSPAERLPGTLELSLRHGRAGATIFRVHDVGEHARLLAGMGGGGLGATARGSP